ncbi:hypothetical protein Tco_0862054 [Tanacetum coccineum]
MVAFLSKPAKSEGFGQIVDFLNAHPIKHALTVNLTIYTLCIEQFWATVKAKTINREVQLQALVDGKKIIITESTTRRDLQLKDAEGVDCLPNATIFEQLSLMGYEQKFNFSKFIFESMVKNLDNVGKFLMYPRFVQVFLDKQLEGMSNHNRIYVTPSHTKKIFGNMRRVGKGFSGRETPLFPIMVVHNQEEMGEGSAIPTDPHHTPTFIQPSPQPQKTQKPRRPKKKDTQVPQSSVPSDNVADEAVYKELDDSLVRAATTASSLEAEQDSGNIIKTRSKATPNEAGSQGTTSGGGPRRQETMGDTIAQTRFENVSKLSNDPLLARGNTLRSGEDSLKLNELMELCTNLQQRVLDLETTKTTQANEIASLKRRVKKLEKKDRSRTHKLKRLYKVGLSARMKKLPYGKMKMLEEVVDAAQDKGKGIMIELVKPIKKKDLIRLDEEVALKLQAEFDEEERLAREKTKTEQEANIALIETWDDIQAKIDVDHQLAERLQEQEQEELSVKEKATLFQQLLEKRRKHFAAKRAEEKRNKPPTKAQ